MRQATADVSCWIGFVSSLQIRQATADVSWWIGFCEFFVNDTSNCWCQLWDRFIEFFANETHNCWSQLMDRFCELFANEILTTGQVTHMYFDVVLPWHLSVFLLLSSTPKATYVVRWSERHRSHLSHSQTQRDYSSRKRSVGKLWCVLPSASMIKIGFFWIFEREI